MSEVLKRYAQLLVNYCVELQPEDRLYISSATIAEPLIREVYRCAIDAGAHVEMDLTIREQSRIFYEHASDWQLDQVPILQKKAFDSFDAYLYIRAPFNHSENHNLDSKKTKRRGAAMAPLSKRYFERTGDRSLRRNLCEYPTIAGAQLAGLSLEEYEQFIFNACRLDEPDPIQAWLDVRRQQQGIVDHLNSCTTVRYVNSKGTDISFSTEGRKWINSDGQTNMPSGEVYTSPVENSVNGVIHFDYPSLRNGQDIEGVTLTVKDGYIEKWTADRGQSVLDHVFTIPGARYFGEAAIGTNYRVNRLTKNILFDEKIGGSVHMAIGQSYLQAGGKNESAIHWDMIADMREGGAIFADGEQIYENGLFLIGDLKSV